MKEIVIIWIAIILVIVALIFPPYGYTKITGSIISVTSLDIPDIHSVTPWTYVGHSFIFSLPPYISDTSKDGRTTFSFEGMRIGWHIVAIEIAVIILITSGVIFSLRIRRRHKII
jgi:hypothetical protein